MNKGNRAALHSDISERIGILRIPENEGDCTALFDTSALSDTSVTINEDSKYLLGRPDLLGDPVVILLRNGHWAFSKPSKFKSEH